MNFHNPQNLTPDQIPAGYRLITEEEQLEFQSNQRVRPELRCWCGGHFEEGHGNYGVFISETYITPITEPVEVAPTTPQAEPVWHNPRGIESPGEGFRFLIPEEVNGRYYNYDRYPTLSYWNPELDNWIGNGRAGGASLFDTYRISDTTPIPGFPNREPVAAPEAPVEDITEDQAKDILIAFRKPTRDIANSITIAPANPTVRSFAYREMMGRAGFVAPGDPPTTLVEWLAIIKKAYTTPDSAVVNAGVVSPGFVASPRVRDQGENDTAFTIDCYYEETGTATRTVHFTRTVSASISIPVRIAREGRDAVEDYIRDQFTRNANEGCEDVHDDGDINWDDMDWDGYSGRDAQWDEDLDEECEPYLEPEDEEDED